jgi:hypothetical protein
VAAAQTPETATWRPAGSSTIVLNMTSRPISTIRNVQCSNGAFPDIALFSEGVTGNVSSNHITGTVVDSWNVLVAGTSITPPAVRKNRIACPC